MFKDYFEKKATEVVDRIEKTSSHKLIRIVLVFVAFGVVILGLLQIRTTIDQPFLADRLIEDKARVRGPLEFLEFYQQEQRNQQDLINLQQRDSDGDGLTDYQEIYIYRSNAYSADSDGDGISDSQEIQAGSDPTCPQGDTCDEEGFILVEQGGALAQEEIDIAEIVTQRNEGLEQLEQFDTEQRQQLETYFSSLTTEDLKVLLRQQGFPEVELENLSDANLRGTLNAIIRTLE
jgi:hypothetical protein